MSSHKMPGCEGRSHLRRGPPAPPKLNWPMGSWAKLKVCFKPPYFGVLGYAAINNWNTEVRRPLEGFEQWYDLTSVLQECLWVCAENRMKKEHVGRRPVCRAGERPRRLSAEKGFNSGYISNDMWMGSTDGLDVDCKRKKWRMVSEGWPDSGRMKGSSADIWGNHRRSRAELGEIRNSVLDVLRLWGWTHIQVEMPSGVGQWSVWSENRSRLGEVILDIVSVSVVILDQITWAVNADRAEMLADWALGTLASRHRKELEKEPEQKTSEIGWEGREACSGGRKEGISRRKEEFTVSKLLKNQAKWGLTIHSRYDCPHSCYYYWFQKVLFSHTTFACAWMRVCVYFLFSPIHLFIHLERYDHWNFHSWKGKHHVYLHLFFKNILVIL